jgi:ABC-type phosphonate transport system ATPase subunit
MIAEAQRQPQEERAPFLSIDNLHVSYGGIKAVRGISLKVFSGQTFAEVNSFFAFGPGFTGGVRVAAESLTGDTPASIITGPGKG